MKTEDGKTTRIGKEQSTGTTGETGKSQMKNSKKAVSGEIIRGIEKIADALGVKSISTAQTYVQIYGLPAVKNSASVWELDLEKFQAWAKDIGWSPKMHESELRSRIHRKNLEAAGPGQEIRGSINFLEKRLQKNMTTLFDLMRDNAACPIKKLENNEYQVFENEWILFMMDVTPARKTRREIPY